MTDFRRSPLIDNLEDDCLYLGRTRRPLLGGTSVLPINPARQRRLRREEAQDLRKYRLSLQFDPAEKATRRRDQQLLEAVQQVEQQAKQTFLHTALMRLSPDELTDLLDDPEKMECFVAEHQGDRECSTSQ